MPFSIAPAVWAIIASGVIIAGIWIVDAIGDRREAKVHAKYAAAAGVTNDDVAAFNTEDEKVAAVAEALRQQALEKAKSVPGKLIVTKAQAEALSEIRWP